MRLLKTICLTSALCFFGIASAQRSAIYTDPDAKLNEGRVFFDQRKYGQAAQCFAQYLTAPSAARKQEATYYQLACAFEMRQPKLDKQLKDFLKQYPYTAYLSEIKFMQATLLCEREKYKQSLKEFAQVDPKHLSRPHQTESYFYRGYANLQMSEIKAAMGCFDVLRKSESRFTLPSKYYYAYCCYSIKNYGKALPVFLEIEQTEQYRNIAPYYIIQIYYAQKQYDEVFSRADYLLQNQQDNENTGELHRILGEMEYQKGKYDKAAEHLQAYEQAFTKQEKELVREDIYLLGMAYYQIGQYEKAITYLKKVQKQDDELTESTCMHLGQAYLQTSQLAEAQKSFAAAMRYGIDKKLQEEASFNYALTTYQSSTALGESVTAFTDFLEQYPASSHREQVYELLSEVFLSSKNYKAAYDAICKLQQPSPKIKTTKLFLLYQMGTDAFVRNKMQEAIDYFTQVIDNKSTDATTRRECYYWRAEASYRFREYDAADADMRVFLASEGAARSSNYLAGLYTLAYTQFTSQRYTDALHSFQNFLRKADQKSPQYADALNRIGDCYFNARDFVNAESYYAKVISIGKTGTDYAMYQRGYALGLLKRQSDKISVLDRLVTQFPKSDYADDALYEMARAEIARGNDKATIVAYQRLLDSYPNSPLARKANLEMAMIYYNVKNYDNAIAAYKQVVEKYQGSEESFSALEGLESIYIELNRVNEYFAYAKTLGHINVDLSYKEDSISYVAAEKQYMLANYKAAAEGLQRYLDNYCLGGRYCTNAQFYLADSYYRLSQKKEALKAYQQLSEMNGNPYMQEAVTRAAEITYDQADYEASRTYFRKLLQVANSEEKTAIAQLGILRCSNLLGDAQTTIQTASSMLADPNLTEETASEARYNRAKAYLLLSDYLHAQGDLKQLSAEITTSVGAEAKYLLADTYFRQLNYSQAENEIMEFANSKTQQQYWLAKSFILLADISIKQGDLFQAKQYLLSLQANYKQTDDIQSIAAERLQLIADREQEQVITEDNDEE